MYTILLVDDERIILDGISRMVDWDKHRTRLIGTAKNGIEAFERIREDAPDIVISDIRMPGMDGLELVSRVSAAYPRVKFLLLSGYGEFDYARKAMQYGVKHYLLKPTNETKIAEALDELVAELDADDERESFMRGVKQRLDKVMPHVKEQVLKEFVTNKTYGSRDWDFYSGLFQYERDRPVRLLLLQPEGDAQFEQLFAIKNIAEELLPGSLLSTTIGSHVLLLIESPADQQALQRQVEHIRRTFQSYYKTDATIGLSEEGRIANVRSLYQSTLQLLNYRFYLDEGGLITSGDAAGGSDSPPPSDRFAFDEDRLSLPIRSGHVEDAERALADFVAGLKEAQLDIAAAKSYAIGQYVSLIRLAEPDETDRYYRRLPAFLETSSLQAMGDMLGEIVRDIAESRYRRHMVKYTAIVQRMVEIVDEHIGNSDLSLQMVAGEMLYMNADYLGKLFKKETGEKFSNYVMRQRIERATAWIDENADVRIFELAEKLGFGDNPQYFSQVFKKQMGCTPTEYMRK